MPVVMEADRIDRTLTRIAHEVMERNQRLTDIALVGIRTRGVTIAQVEHLPKLMARKFLLEVSILLFIVMI